MWAGLREACAQETQTTLWLVARLVRAGLFTLHKRVVLSACRPFLTAPIDRVGRYGIGLDGSEPEVRPLHPLRPLHSAGSAPCRHGGQCGTQGHHSERSCGAYGSILLVPRHRHFIPDPNGCLKCSPRKNSTVVLLQLKATCLPTHTVTRQVHT